jgi:general secretion pathway protein G
MFNKKNFSFLEIIMFGIVLVLILSVVFFMIWLGLENNKYKTAQKQIVLLQDAVYNFYMDNNVYPTTEQGLNVLYNKPDFLSTWDGPYLTKNFIKDTWRNNYIYNYPGMINKKSFDIMSYGKDGRQGGYKLNKDLYNNEN